MESELLQENEAESKGNPDLEKDTVDLEKDIVDLEKDAVTSKDRIKRKKR